MHRSVVNDTKAVVLPASRCLLPLIGVAYRHEPHRACDHLNDYLLLGRMAWDVPVIPCCPHGMTDVTSLELNPPELGALCLVS